MKKFIYGIALAGIASISALANEVVFLTDQNGDPIYGFVNRVSNNGAWAVAADDGFQTGSYIISIGDKVETTYVGGCELWDITNDGIAVGCWYDNLGTIENPSNYMRGCYYANGKFTLLPTPKEISNGGQYYARSISPDGRYIAGMAQCYAKDSEIGSKYYPCLWTRNDVTGKYELTCYNNLTLPANQGFFTYDVSTDGRVICGTLAAHAGSYVPALIVDGELQVWNKMEWKMWPDYVDHKPTYDKDGNIVYYERGFIDDVMEGYELEAWFNGAFNFISGDYVYGHRSVASNVDVEFGEGIVTHNRTVYNMATGEFLDEPGTSIYSCGLDGDHKFVVNTNGGYYIENGSMRRLASAFSLEVPSEYTLHCVYGASEDGRVLGGSYTWFNEMMGQISEAPMIIVLDQPILSGIADATADTIADDTIYDLTGRRVNGNNLTPGIYIRGGQKFIVK